MPQSGRMLVLGELKSVFLVALGVALAFTIAASAVSQFHQVSAEDLNVSETAAVAAANNTQVLGFNNWDVALTVPQGKGLPAMSWAAEGPDSVGLTAGALEKLGSGCAARNNALGSVLRLPAGGFANYPRGAQTEVLLATMNGHDYVYQIPKSTCSADGSAANVTAQAEAAIEGSGVMTATGQ